jgi:hypothetical protein
MSTLALSRRFGFPCVDDGIGMLGLPAEQSAKRQLSGSADEVVKTIAAVLDEMVLGVIAKRTALEFAEATNATLPNYVKLVWSYAQIVSAIVPPNVLARLTAESFSELEADIREHAVQAFGADTRDRAVFTVWTLRKTSDLLQLMVARVTDGDEAKDQEFLTNFLLHALRARFNVDCLRASMRMKRAIYPEALGLIADGLRSAVDAYAWIKQAVDLRIPTDESSLVVQTSWDAEDQGLLDESMQDMAQEDNVDR